MKGQIFSLDLIFSFLIFIAILLSIAFAWDIVSQRIHDFEQREDLETISIRSFSSLILTPGYPFNWTEIYDTDPDRVRSIGLSGNLSFSGASLNYHSLPSDLGSGVFEIDESKYEKFESISQSNYSHTKTLLGVLGPNYNYFFEILRWNGISYDYVTSSGRNYSRNASEVVVTEAFVVYNDSTSKVRYSIWKECLLGECE